MNIFSRLIKIISSNFPDVTDIHSRIQFERQNFDGRVEDEPENNQSQFGQDSPQKNPALVGYYANLEVPYGSNLETVRKSWKRLVRKYHPDLHSADPEKRRVANELTQGLNRAYKEITKKLENDGAVE